jgi:hypothetical protein
MVKWVRSSEVSVYSHLSPWFSKSLNVKDRTYAEVVKLFAAAPALGTSRIVDHMH